MRFLLTALLATAMVGCAFDREDRSGPDKAVVRQNESVDRDYGPLVGIYNGTLTGTGGRVQTVRLIVAIRNENSRNSDGTPTVIRVPYATFTRINPIGPDFSLKLSYVPQTGNITFTNVESGAGGGGAGAGAGNNEGGTPGSGGAGKARKDDDVNTIYGTVTGQVIRGEVTSFTQATLGFLEVSKSSTQTDVPPEDRNRRLKEFYQNYVGQYCGTAEDRYSSKPQILSIKLSLDEAADPTSPTGTRPILSAFYERLDKVPGLLDLRMSVGFDTPPAVLLFGRGLGSYTITITGNLDGRTIVGNLSTGKEGSLGTVTLKRDDPLCKTQRPKDPINPRN